MTEFDADEKAFYDLLKTRQDSEGIVHYSPSELETELSELALELDELLHKLYLRGALVYVTRINKETGEILKIVQLIEEEIR